MSGFNTKKSDSDPALQGQAISSQVGQGSASQEVPGTTEAAQEDQTTPEEGQTTTGEIQDTTTEESQVATTQEGQDTTTEEGQVTTQESQATTQESQVTTTQGCQDTATQEIQATTTQGSQTAAITISTAGSTRPWNLIYSEPGIFNEMLQRYGVQGVVVHDIFTLELLGAFTQNSTYAIILAFEYQEGGSQEGPEDHDEDVDNIMFSHQIVVNSCATQSLVNTLMNLDIERGPLIQGFMDYTENMNSVERGTALGTVTQFDEIHNSYGEETAEVEESGQQEEGETESVYHFASYIPKNGFLWELDSLKLNATKLMAINDGDNWLELLQAFLQDKIETGNIEANLLAVVRDPLLEKETELATLIAQDEQLGNALNNEILNPNEPSTSTAPIRGSNLTPKGRKIQKQQNDLKKAIQKLQGDVATLREEGPAALMTMATSAPVEPPVETFTTKGKGKSRSIPIGPKITKAAASMIQRGRGRGRGTRGRGSRGRGSRGRGQTTGSSETSQCGTPSSGTKASRKRRFDDRDAEAARKANANKRYNFRK